MKKIIATLVLTMSFLPLFALAQGGAGETPTFTGASVFKDISEQFKETAGASGLAGGKTENALPQYIARIINMMLGFLTVVFLILILYAGFNWMTAGGEEEKVTKAKTLLTNAVIGLAIILLAYAITKLVFDILLEKRRIL